MRACNPARPSRAPPYVHFRATSSRCHRRMVSGVTRVATRRQQLAAGGGRSLEPEAPSRDRSAVARSASRRGRVGCSRTVLTSGLFSLMLGHASLVQTQRYLNLTDEEVRKAMEVSWDRKKQLRLVAEKNERKKKRDWSRGREPRRDCPLFFRRLVEKWLRGHATNDTCNCAVWLLEPRETSRRFDFLAPQAGFEPATLRLTAITAPRRRRWTQKLGDDVGT